MSNSLTKIYEKHHSENRPKNFSILEIERGQIFKEIIGEQKKILDIGCRDGVLTKYFLKNNHVLGVDVDTGALEKASRDIGIETLPVDLNGQWDELQGRRFDVVVAGEVLEHLYFPDKVISQVAEHLVKDEKSIFLGSVPNAFSIKNRLRYVLGRKKYTPLSDPTHINHFDLKELEVLLKKYFFNVNIIGLGRYKVLSRIYPAWFAFDLVFVCKDPK